jgi:hypothetical protein
MVLASRCEEHSFPTTRIVETVEDPPGDGGESVDVDVPVSPVLPGAPSLVAVPTRLEASPHRWAHLDHPTK